MNNQAPPSRYPFLDFWRGFAVFHMIIFHIIYDMSFLGIVSAEVAINPVFMGYGKAIMFSFLFCAGLSLALVHHKGIKWRAFLKREAKLIAAAALVTIGTYIAFPQQFVFFGILHCMAVCSLVALIIILLPKIPALVVNISLFLALLVPYYGWDFNLPWFDIPHVISMDYVSPFPWSGLFFLGIAGYHLKVHQFQQNKSWFPKIKWLGKHSLVIYLLHQPVIIGILNGYIYLTQ